MAVRRLHDYVAPACYSACYSSCYSACYSACYGGGYSGGCYGGGCYGGGCYGGGCYGGGCYGGGAAWLLACSAVCFHHKRSYSSSYYPVGCYGGCYSGVAGVSYGMPGLRQLHSRDGRLADRTAQPDGPAGDRHPHPHPRRPPRRRARPRRRRRRRRDGSRAHPGRADPAAARARRRRPRRRPHPAAEPSRIHRELVSRTSPPARRKRHAVSSGGPVRLSPPHAAVTARCGRGLPLTRALAYNRARRPDSRRRERPRLRKGNDQTRFGLGGGSAEDLDCRPKDLAP